MGARPPQIHGCQLEQNKKVISINLFEMEQRRRSLAPFNQVTSLPVQYSQRSCTDVCCLICGILFSLLMLILAAATFNYSKYYKVNFPADSNGNLCGIDKESYPYVYFANPPSMERRVCVSECPKQGDTRLKCIPTDNTGCNFSNSPGFEVFYYDNAAEETRSGHFCLPTDPELRAQLMRNSELNSRDSFYNSIDTIVLSFFVALGFSILYFLLVQCFPTVMNYAAMVVGLIVIVATIICIFTYQTENPGVKIAAGVILIIVFIVIVMTVLKNKDSWDMHRIFLKYSTVMVKDRMTTLLYIPLFFAILVCFVIILVLEFTAYWTTGNVSFDGTKSLYHQLSGVAPIILSVLLIVHALWGLTFIKEAFNFCVSGQTVLWYFGKNEGFCYPFKLLLCKHLGSVIAGSFMTGFFSFFDFVFDFLKPSSAADSNGCYYRFYNCCCICCVTLFDLVRSDAMAFINLTGNPFCNSARYCEYLCDRSTIMDYSQSTSRAYRICAHFLLAGIMGIFALYVKGNISIYALVIVMVQTIFIATLLISIHADAAEAIQIVFLSDEEFSRRHTEDLHQQYIRQDYDANLRSLSIQVIPNLHREVADERIRQRKLQTQS